MKRSLKQRLGVLALLSLPFLGLYGVGRHYSPAIVAYLVRHALVQKAPEGVNPGDAARRFDALIGNLNEDDKMLRLLSLSNYLEKVQKLTPAEFERLMAAGPTAPAPGS